MEDWQRDIIEIIRQESFYFYPQYCTKILNEGIASFIHADFMSKLDSINPEEHLDFCRVAFDKLNNHDFLNYKSCVFAVSNYRIICKEMESLINEVENSLCD